MITNQKELRAEFWRQHPGLDRRKVKGDRMARSGQISEALAQRATLN
jgi:hypothetical protein